MINSSNIISFKMKTYLLFFVFAVTVSVSYAVVGKECTTNDDCLGSDNKADDRQKCDTAGSKKCICQSDDYVTSKDNYCKFKDRDGDISCELDIDCEDIDTLGTGSSKCDTGKKECQCPVNKWVIDKKEKQCYAVGITCTDGGSECPERLTCSSKKCACASGYALADDKLQCRKVVDMGIYCQLDVDCELIISGDEKKNATCNSNQCVCPASKWIIGENSEGDLECYSLGADCGDKDKCGTHETCDKQCKCSKDYEATEEGHGCRKHLGTDLVCDNTIDCEVIILNGGSTVECLKDPKNEKQNKCNCTAPANWSIRQYAGTLQTFAQIGAACTKAEDCSQYISNSTCTDKKCVCADDFEASDNKDFCNYNGSTVLFSSFFLVAVSLIFSKTT